MTKLPPEKMWKSEIKGPKSLSLSTFHFISMFSYFYFILATYPSISCPFFRKKTAQTVKNYPSYASFRGLWPVITKLMRCDTVTLLMGGRFAYVNIFWLLYVIPSLPRVVPYTIDMYSIKKTHLKPKRRVYMHRLGFFSSSLS